LHVVAPNIMEGKFRALRKCDDLTENCRDLLQSINRTKAFECLERTVTKLLPSYFLINPLITVWY